MPNTIDIPMGWPYPQRKKHLDELTSSQEPKFGHQLTFQRQLRIFDVYRVPIDLPKYRLANGRTQAAQEEYLAKHPELGPNFFTLDQESEQVQGVQHSLLLEMVKNSMLWTYFQDLSHSQEDPLVLSHNGFVVNGNRRLCGLRELYYGDQVKYAQYQYVDVTVLPVCSD